MIGYDRLQSWIPIREWTTTIGIFYDEYGRNIHYYSFESRHNENLNTNMMDSIKYRGFFSSSFTIVTHDLVLNLLDSCRPCPDHLKRKKNHPYLSIEEMQLHFCLKIKKNIMFVLTSEMLLQQNLFVYLHFVKLYLCRKCKIEPSPSDLLWQPCSLAPPLPSPSTHFKSPMFGSSTYHHTWSHTKYSIDEFFSSTLLGVWASLMAVVQHARKYHSVGAMQA